MQIWRIEGTERYVSAPNKGIARMVFNVPNKALIWVKADELTQMLLKGCVIEETLEPPIVQTFVLKPRQIAIRQGSAMETTVRT